MSNETTEKEVYLLYASDSDPRQYRYVGAKPKCHISQQFFAKFRIKDKMYQFNPGLCSWFQYTEERGATVLWDIRTGTKKEWIDALTAQGHVLYNQENKGNKRPVDAKVEG